MMISRLVRPVLITVVILSATFTALMGFAHTKAGRPLLSLLGRMPGSKAACPLGFDVAQSPAQREAARRLFAAQHAGTTNAQLRPALGFTLEQTTRAEVKTWAAANGVRCEKPRSGGDLECQEIPGALLPSAYAGAAVQTLWLNFGAEEQLVSVIAVRRDANAELISSTFRAVTAGLTREAGPAASHDNDASSAFLTAGLLRQSSAEYRFRNYFALARATNMGSHFVLTEEYRSLPN